MNSKAFFIQVIIAFIFSLPAYAQDKNNYIRVAKIVVDSARLDAYKTALKEGIEAAVRTEPGVLTLYAVQAKDNPAHITVFEVYESVAAYNVHIQTPHFKKYKTTVQDMVRSLELTDMEPVALSAKHRH